jgi:hypothetical protein
MAFTRRAGTALVIAGSAITLAAAAPRVFSPGYTYHMTIDSHVTEPNGRTRDFVAMSGRASVNAHGGRLDIDDVAKDRSAMGEKGGYFLYDATSMMIVSPKEKQVVRFGFDDLEKGMSQLASVPGMNITVSDVNVGVEKLGAGESLLGMSTTRFRVTQDYKIAMKVAFMNRSSTEHIVQEYWMADQKNGLANPFARMGSMRMGGGGFGELASRTSDAMKSMGKGIPLKTITTTTSTSGKGEKTETVSTMQITDLQTGDVDDASLKAPSDYKVVDVGEQMKAMGAQLEQAKAAQAAQQAQSSEAKKAQAPDSSSKAQPSAEAEAKEAAKQALRKGMGGLMRRP